jgi:hypothetical protein
VEVGAGVGVAVGKGVGARVGVGLGVGEGIMVGTIRGLAPVEARPIRSTLVRGPAKFMPKTASITAAVRPNTNRALRGVAFITY